MSLDSRRFPRLKQSCKVRYKLIESDVGTGQGIEAFTVNISGGGVCFRVEDRLERGALLAVELEIPDFESPVVSLGRVARCEPCEDGGFDVGMEFWWIGWGDDGAQKAISAHIKQALDD